MELIAMSYAWKVSLALIFIFFVLFPAIVTVLLAAAVSGTLGERAQNLADRRRGPTA
jgi:archaellum component FlaG (FlaF/FlaG flagellin family)